MSSNGMDLQSIIDRAYASGAVVNPNRNAGKNNPFAGTPYESLWENNPYASLYYDPSFWDSIGLSDKSKDANSEYQRLYEEYIAGIYDQQRQDVYNSETESVKRMKSAGLNADLLGLDGHSNTGQMSAPNAGPIASLNGQSPAMGALSSITSVLGFATSTLQQIQGIKGLISDNTSKSLGNFEKFTELARPHIINEMSNRFSGGIPNNWSDISEMSGRSLGLSRRDTKRYKNAFASLLGSSQFTSSKQAYENMSANDKAMNHYIQKMSELAILAEKHRYKGEISKSIYDEGYFDSLDPAKAANAVNRDNDNKGWLDKWRNDYYKTLYDDFKNGSQLAGLILIGSTSLPNLIAGSAISGSKTKWSTSGIEWNDSVIRGLAKKLQLF